MRLSTRPVFLAVSVFSALITVIMIQDFRQAASNNYVFNSWSSQQWDTQSILPEKRETRSIKHREDRAIRFAKSGWNWSQNLGYFHNSVLKSSGELSLVKVFGEPGGVPENEVSNNFEEVNVESSLNERHQDLNDVERGIAAPDGVPIAVEIGDGAAKTENFDSNSEKSKEAKVVDNVDVNYQDDIGNSELETRLGDSPQQEDEAMPAIEGNDSQNRNSNSVITMNVDFSDTENTAHEYVNEKGINVEENFLETEIDVCQLLDSHTQHLSPLATISNKIMNADPPLTQAQIAEIYRKGCGLTLTHTEDGLPTWKEGSIVYIPKNKTAAQRSGNIAVYNADFEPYIPYNHTEFFEGEAHPPVAVKDRKILLARMSGWDDIPNLEPLKTCPDLPCSVTTNWRRYNRRAAAITFNGQIVKGRVPKRWHKDQVFVLYYYEPLTSPWPSYRYLYNPKLGWKTAFNWTMTYHMTSDILSTYGMVRRRPPGSVESKNYTEIVALKTRKVAWFVSHCYTFSHREKYVAQLQKYMAVDIFGKCGPYKCKKETDIQCFERVGREYKFYFAFENAMCEDYTTEKFFRIYASNTIVVTRGNKFLYRSLPTDTFIDASEFDSPKALADRLLYLDTHPEEYIAMLKRKDEMFASYQDYPHYLGTTLWVKYTWENVPLCELCQRVWNLEKYKKTYPDILSWLNQRKCKPPTDVIES